MPELGVRRSRFNTGKSARNKPRCTRDETGGFNGLYALCWLSSPRELLAFPQEAPTRVRCCWRGAAVRRELHSGETKLPRHHVAITPS